MGSPLRRPLRGPARALAAAAASLAVVAASCTSGDEAEDLPLGLGRGPTATADGPPPTLPSGVDLPAADPVEMFVGEGLAFGSVLPSVDAALGELRAAEEVAGVVARQVYDRGSAAPLALLVVVEVDGGGFHDEDAIDTWVAGLVATFAGGASTERVVVEGSEVVRAAAPGELVAGVRQDALAAVLQGPPAEVEWALTTILAARAAGAVGSGWPETPVVDLPPPAAFVEVAGVEFVPFPPAEEEPPPAGPVVAGMLGAEGRIGVVGGERRTTVWSVSMDPGAHPTAESLNPVIEAAVTGRTGASASVAEVGDRLVASADGADRSARAFTHGRLVLIVEGRDPAQVDAVVTAWITALAG